MKTLLKVLVAVVVVCLLAAGGFFMWAKSTASALLDRRVEQPGVEFPVPFPLSEAEVAALRAERAKPAATPAPSATAQGEAPDPLAGVDLKAIALERAIARGKHLVESRYACIECHGANFAGGTMIDDPAVGQVLGPNITAGKGGVTGDYTTADWDRIVRHGVGKGGTVSLMPAVDFQSMSDQELSDIVAYIRSLPAVDAEVPASKLGPLGVVLVATGQFYLSWDIIPDHGKTPAKLPPAAEPTPTFGKHLAGVCTGCHRQNLVGGPVPGGPPDWAHASNLTPHAEGMKDWTFEQFETVMREGKRPNGEMVKMPMTLMTPYTQRMTDVEMKALWAYLKQVAPAAR